MSNLGKMAKKNQRQMAVLGGSNGSTTVFRVAKVNYKFVIIQIRLIRKIFTGKKSHPPPYLYKDKRGLNSRKSCKV